MNFRLRGEYAFCGACSFWGSINPRDVVAEYRLFRSSKTSRSGSLRQILNDLKSAGCVRTAGGRGYQLARKPEEITLASVVRSHRGGERWASGGLREASGF